METIKLGNFAKIDFNALITARPEVLETVGPVEYVQNPYCSTRPIIALNRAAKTAIETDWRSMDDMLWQL